jgi:hypothetical protein
MRRVRFAPTAGTDIASRTSSMVLDAPKIGKAGELQYYGGSTIIGTGVRCELCSGTLQCIAAGLAAL